MDLLAVRELLDARCLALVTRREDLSACGSEDRGDSARDLVRCRFEVAFCPALARRLRQSVERGVELERGLR